MGDWRRYTGTQTLQVGWTVLAICLGLAAAVVPVDIPRIITVGVISVIWLVGLLALGLRERRHWNKMVSRSSFDRDGGTRSADLEKLLQGRSVIVSTTVPSLFSQTHTEISVPVKGVNASFTISVHNVGTGGTNSGITTGNETLDERFVIEGSEQNIAKLLSADVQAALMDIETPGTCTITGERVIYVVPFTRLSATELETISDGLIAIAERLESIGRGG